MEGLPQDNEAQGSSASPQMVKLSFLNIFFFLIVVAGAIGFTLMAAIEAPMQNLREQQEEAIAAREEAPAPTPTTMKEMTPIHTPIPLPEGYELTDTKKMYTNLSNTYSVVLHKTTEPDVQARSTCVIYTEEVETNARVGLLNFVETQCAEGVGGLYPTGETFTTIVEWISDSEFVIDNANNTLTKYSLYTEPSTFSYDKSTHKVVAVHDDVVILGTKDNDPATNDETYSFNDFNDASKLRDDWVIFPTEGDNINRTGLFLIEYDRTNNGFFAITTESPENEVIYNFYWLPTETLEATLLDTINHTVISGGRGCAGGELASETQGEIVYKGLDCFILPQEYLDANELRFAIPASY